MKHASLTAFRTVLRQFIGLGIEQHNAFHALHVRIVDKRIATLAAAYAERLAYMGGVK